MRMNGTVIAAPQTFNYFERIQERIVSFVAKNSRISKKKFLGLMLKTGEMAADVGSVIYGEEAVELGLIDRIGGLSDALDCLYEQIAEVRKEQKRTASEKARKKKKAAGKDRRIKQVIRTVTHPSSGIHQCGASLPGPRPPQADGGVFMPGSGKNITTLFTESNLSRGCASAIIH